jgi:hypothetical protein
VGILALQLDLERLRPKAHLGKPEERQAGHMMAVGMEAMAVMVEPAVTAVVVVVPVVMLAMAAMVETGTASALPLDRVVQAAAEIGAVILVAAVV